MFIPDKQVQAAFDILNSPDHAKARAAHEYAEKRLKVVLAKAQLAANGKTVGEREATALASEEYEAACKHARMPNTKIDSTTAIKIAASVASM